jgi:hypothetical protein
MTPDQSKPFEIECDASKYATGAILYQKDDNGYKHPINFYSKTLTPAEHNYNIHDRELLTIVRAFEEWRVETLPRRIITRSFDKIRSLKPHVLEKTTKDQQTTSPMV